MSCARQAGPTQSLASRCPRKPPAHVASLDLAPCSVSGVLHSGLPPTLLHRGHWAQQGQAPGSGSGAKQATARETSEPQVGQQGLGGPHRAVFWTGREQHMVTSPAPSSDSETEYKMPQAGTAAGNPLGAGQPIGVRTSKAPRPTEPGPCKMRTQIVHKAVQPGPSAPKLITHGTGSMKQPTEHHGTGAGEMVSRSQALPQQGVGY